jgi:hypothetical protein
MKNKKIYIGQTHNTIQKRFKQHTNLAGKDETYFHNALKKYGVDSFKLEEIDSADTKEEADYLEKFWISFYHSDNRIYGYNSTNGGGGTVGYKHSKESNQKKSEFRKSENNPLRVAVLQFDLDMNFIKEWSSIKYASEFVGIPDTNITRACKGRRKTAGGYIWKYKDAMKKVA